MSGKAKPSTRPREYATFSAANRAFSDRPRRRQDQELPNRAVSRPIPETLTYLLMKEKFEQIYKHIERISLKDDPLPNRPERNSDSPDRSTPTVPSLTVNPLQLDAKQEHPTPHPQKRVSVPDARDCWLEVNTGGSRGRMKGVSLKEQMRKSRYRKKMLEPLSVGKQNLSNNIKDYLSVGRIAVREAEETALARVRRLKTTVHESIDPSELSEPTDPSVKLSQSQVALQSPPPKRRRAENVVVRRFGGKFKPPFALYNYRDFMWKVAFSNQFLVQPVAEYETKLKYFVGPGNNSNLIKGLMRRRPWFTLTEKPQDAHFVWTQIKLPSVFQLQKKGEPLAALPVENGKEGEGFALFNAWEKQRWREYWSRNVERERTMKEGLRARTSAFGLTEHTLSEVRGMRVHNHLPNSFLIGNKKALFKTMSDFYTQRGQQVFDFLPLTFHIKRGLEDDEYLKFLQHFYAIARENKGGEGTHPHNAWIVKPGENTNRGNGILVCLDLPQLKAILRRNEKHGDGSPKTYVLQKYIERPLLYRRRKFDLRHYLMLTALNGTAKGYWYRHGYVRTTSTEYSLAGTAGAVHLTNDAVQKNLPDYGKYEKGNKITYQELDAFLKKTDPAFDFQTVVYPQMKATATAVIQAAAVSLDPQRRSNFEVFGLDFMIDADYRVWLIEVNTNPCLETTCPVLAQVIPTFIEHALQIAIDPLFPAPLAFQPAYPPYLANLAEDNAFELVFDERVDAAAVLEEAAAGDAEEEEEVFDDDGEDFAD